MTITYLYNSGFSVALNGRSLIFDPVGGGVAEPDRGAIVFVSHAHGDHFDPVVETWRSEGRIALVTGYDVPSGGSAMRPGDTLQIDGVHIEAYGSTDEGISFLTRAGGYTLFHAGDFNLWHWRDESTRAEIDAAYAAFLRVLETLKGRAIDIAFFPVDPRMGTDYDEGARLFIETLSPSLLIPMHFREDAAAALAFEQEVNARWAKTRVKALTKPGETYTL